MSRTEIEATPTGVPLQFFEELRRIRAFEPGRIQAAHAARQRRRLLIDGRLFVIAADHPARGALGVGGRQMAMGDRYDLLNRLVIALGRPGVDGVLSTPDIIDDLALLGALDDKIVVGSMNRGGLKGSVFEMDDRFTGYDIDGIVRDRLDFAKSLLRVNLDDHGSVWTMQRQAEAVRAAAAAEIPIMIEPFMSKWRDSKSVNDLSTEAVITSISIASGLGDTSAYTWLKIPVVEDMERVMAATTLPTLLLGGEPSGDSGETYRRWAHALKLPGVRGLVVGRTLVYPPDGDVAAAVDAAASLVHGETT